MSIRRDHNMGNVKMIAGIDYSSHGATVALVGFEGQETAMPEVYRATFRSRREEAWDGLMRVPTAMELCGCPWSDVGMVWVERGFGGSRRSDFMLGAFQGAIAVSVRYAVGHCVVNETTSTEWRQTLGIKVGATKKGQAKVEVAEALYRWGVQPTEDDNANDAIGIALAGRELNRRALERLYSEP